MSAASPAQIAANQANAQLSTGPATPDGKRRSSLNATRHGLTGRVVVLPSEDLGVYEAFAQELLTSLDPKTPLERELAQTVVDQQWRLKRIRTIEDGMLALGDSKMPESETAVDSALAAAQAFLENSKAFVNLTIYEQRIHRILEKALAQLKQLQAERKALEQAQIEEALRLQKLHKEEGLPYDPQSDGFVFRAPNWSAKPPAETATSSSNRPTGIGFTRGPRAAANRTDGRRSPKSSFPVPSPQPQPL